MTSVPDAIVVEPVETADVVAAAVLAVPGVSSLHPGGFGEVATYLAGRRVTGVRIGEEGVEVHVVLEPRTDLRGVAQRIHERVTEVARRPVRVFVEDLADDPADNAAEDPAGHPADDAADDLAGA